MSLNRATLIGRLGKDPESKYTPGGSQLTKFSIATDNVYKDKSGEQQRETEWHNIIAWGKLAEICEKYLQKGREVFVEGRITHRKYEGRDGEQRIAYEIVAEKVVLLGSGSSGSKGEGSDRGNRERSEPQQEQHVKRGNSSWAAAGPRNTAEHFESGFGKATTVEQSLPASEPSDPGEITDSDIPF